MHLTKTFQTPTQIRSQAFKMPLSGLVKYLKETFDSLGKAVEVSLKSLQRPFYTAPKGLIRPLRAV